MTAPQVEPGPFDLGPRDGRGAVLCLHGLTGTPWEVRSLGEALGRLGLRARGPVLPGHGHTPAALARVSFHDWLDATRDEVERLRRAHSRVAVAGLSMGGLLSLALAAEGRVDAVVAVATPVRFAPPLPQILPLAKRLRPFLPKSAGSDIRDPEARARHPGYRVMPLESVHQLVRLQRRVREGIARVRVPAFLAHGVHDRTAAPRDARWLHRRLRGSRLLWCEQSAHVVPVDHDGPRLADEVGRFACDRLGGPR